MEAAMLKTVLEFGSFGLVAFVVVWMVLRGAPLIFAHLERMQNAHRQALKASQDAFQGQLERMESRMEQRHAAYLAEQQKMNELLTRVLEAQS